MARSEGLELAGPAGRLEAILMHPETSPLAAAVVCHAHPLHGGIMHFKPVFRAAKALQRAGLAALRFNFRGVGRSEGSHDHGRGERDDARAAVEETARRFAGLPLVLGGFSFGAAVALRAGADDRRVRAFFALGYPLSLDAEPGSPADDPRPRLFVQGEHDAFGSPEALGAALRGQAGPHELARVSGADHFFSGRLDALEQLVLDWAARRPWEAT